MNIKTIASAVLAAVVLCAAPAFADGKMNLNTATEQELSANPAVGPELAKGIVEFRENVGDIKSMDELLEVKGVTPEVLEKLKQAVTVEAIEGGGSKAVKAIESGGSKAVKAVESGGSKAVKVIEAPDGIRTKIPERAEEEVTLRVGIPWSFVFPLAGVL